MSEEKYDEGPEWQPPPPPKRGQNTTETVCNFLEYLVRRFRPLRKHWFNTGVATIATATTTSGTYEDVLNFITQLGYPATTGVVQNRGPGNLFFVISVQPDDKSGNEIQLAPGQTFRWGGPDNPHQIYYMHLRADIDATEYQVMGGSGKLEITDAPLTRRTPSVTTLIDATTFNNVTTSENSSSVDTTHFKFFLLTYSLTVASTPTDIVLQVQFSDDGGTTWFDYQNDFFGDLRFDDTAVGASGINEGVKGDCAGRLFRLAVTATGTDATKTFTLTAKIEFYS